jgi:hypothetical protein
VPQRVINYLPLDEIKRYDRNPKKHAIGVLRTSIERFGFTTPMMLCERRLLLAEGHGRLEALQQMHLEGLGVPSGIEEAEGEWLVPVVRGWSSKSDAEFEAYVIASNQTVIAGGWQEDNLLEHLNKIDDLAGIGFGEEDIAQLTKRLQEVEPPAGFPQVDSDIATAHECPKCGYEWS